MYRVMKSRDMHGVVAVTALKFNVATAIFISADESACADVRDHLNINPNDEFKIRNSWANHGWIRNLVKVSTEIQSQVGTREEAILLIDHTLDGWKVLETFRYGGREWELLQVNGTKIQFEMDDRELLGAIKLPCGKWV